MNNRWNAFGALGAAVVLACGVTPALAQVPPDIAAKIKAIGPKIDFSVMALYAPLQAKPPYPGVTVTRDVAYGSDPLQRLDVLEATASGKPRPVMLFVHGGGFVRGDKAQTDNMLVWAVNHGMVGVDINYRLAPKDPWPAGAQDLASAIAWTKANIKGHGGDPNRIFIWGHSAGANHVADYVAHTELQGPEASSVKGAIILSAFYAEAVAGPPNAYYGSDASLQSSGASIARMIKTPIPLFVANAEYDPDGFRAYAAALDAALTQAHRKHGRRFLKDHDHLSEGLAVGTADVSLTKPLLAWIQSVP